MDTKYIKEILTKDIGSLGCEIWGIEFFGRHSNQTLRIYIDKTNGISIHDCEKVSRHVTKVLDAEDHFSNKYLLEVSSPGIDRRFFFNEQYRKYLDNYLKVKFIDSEENKRTISGVLTKTNETNIFVESGEEIMEIPFSSIIQANLIM